MREKTIFKKIATDSVWRIILTILSLDWAIVSKSHFNLSKMGFNQKRLGQVYGTQFVQCHILILRER